MMTPRVQKIFLILFLIAFAATIIIYFISDKNMRYTWFAGGSALLFYFFYRFSKQ
jgi:hypothetical protein